MPTPGKPVLLLVWWSATGAGEQLAGAAADGARADAGVEVRVRRAEQAGPQDVLAASALLVVTPEMLGSMAGAMKAFFERCYYPVLDRLEGRAYATIVCAGSDGQGATRQIDRIVTGWRLRRVAPPQVVVLDAQTPERILARKTVAAAQLEAARELGAALAAGLAMRLW